jgi:hypothetical protein
LERPLTFSFTLSVQVWGNPKYARKKSTAKKYDMAGCQWLMPIILATWETELRSIKVRNQHGKNSSRDPISIITKGNGLEVRLKW